jgi:hypothetical protein
VFEMLDVEIAGKLAEAIKLLREVGQAYDDLSEPERKTLRHVTYQRTGSLGRIILYDKGELLVKLGQEGKRLEEKNT